MRLPDDALIGLGSCAEYDWTGEGTTPWPETRRIAPATPYGAAKAALAARWVALGERRGVAVAWARLFHLFGPGEHPDRLVPAVLDALLAGRPALTGSGRLVRDFASTGFLGRALAALAASDVVGPINVASGQPVSTRAVVEAIGRITDRADLLRLGALPDRAEPPFIVADTTRLACEVGFNERADMEADLTALL